MGVAAASQRRSEPRVSSATPGEQHYGHAALLVASCVAYAPKNRAAKLVKWAMDLRQPYRRRHTFREELARACENLSVFVPV